MSMEIVQEEIPEVWFWIILKQGDLHWLHDLDPVGGPFDTLEDAKSDAPINLADDEILIFAKEVNDG